MKILLLEDIDSFYETIRDGLHEYRTELGMVDLTRIATELEFRERLASGELASAGFDVAIFDVMVGWCTPEDIRTGKGVNPPPEVMAELERDKRWRSGVRCRRLFQEALDKAKAPQTPCIYYTALEAESLVSELSDDTPLIVKSAADTSMIANLVSAVKQAAEQCPRHATTTPQGAVP